MKLKRFKTKWIIAVTLAIVLISIISISSFSTNYIGLQSSDNDEDDIIKELTDVSIDELCDEINALSDKGVVLQDLMYHSIAFANKINSVSKEDLINIISDEENSSNLKVIAIQAVDYIDTEKYSNINEFAKNVVLNENEDMAVRENAIWLLDKTDESYSFLERLIVQGDEKLAFQALKKINNEDTERAVKIANSLIENKEENEKLRIAIKVISEQMIECKDTLEKDKWVSYCIKTHEKAVMEKDALMCDTVIFALSDMHYKKAIYEIIQNNKVDEAVKKFCIGQNYQVLIDVLENNPSKEDIEMAIKAMTLLPVDKTVYVLDDVIKKSKYNYDLEPIFSQKLEPALEKWNEE